MNKIFDYTNLTLNELIEKISIARFFHLPKMVAEAFRKIPSGGSEPTYKVYTALLTQSGTDAPAATVLENTLGDIVWNYEDVGVYSATVSGSKSILIPNDFTQDFNIIGVVNTESIVYLYTNKLVDLLGANEILSNTPIEIRVYN